MFQKGYPDLSMNDREFIHWQYNLAGSVPKEKEIKDYPFPGLMAKPTINEMHSDLATMYILRDLGPNYCFLSEERKLHRRKRFIDNHFKVKDENRPNAKILKEIRTMAERVSNKSGMSHGQDDASSPEALHNLFIEFAKIRYGNNIKNVYKSARRKQEGDARRAFERKEELRIINTEIRDNMVLRAYLPKENLSLFD